MKRKLPGQGKIVPFTKPEPERFTGLPLSREVIREGLIYKTINDLLRTIPQYKDNARREHACSEIFNQVMKRSEEFKVKPPATIIEEEINAFLGPENPIRASMDRLSERLFGPDEEG
ncbi:MAG: hypothetical protein MN733_17995 [Nitrososphaera sp.]|nr:hypothetical protein [Nitrososphaera sp.]